MKEEGVLYVRNRRPNRLVLKYNGLREVLDHRGSRQDSTSIPVEAERDPSIARFIKLGYLEKISRESFMKLAKRTIDTLPNEFLKRSQRSDRGITEIMMYEAKDDYFKGQSDTSGEKIMIKDGDVRKLVNPSPQWAGDLMTTEEELETIDLETAEQNYPSKHRDATNTRAMGY